LRAISRETWIGVGAAAIGIAAMAIDHLLEDSGSFDADRAAFVYTSALVLVVTGLVFGREVPRVKAQPSPPAGAITPGFVCASIAVLGMPFTLWLGLPFPLGGGALAFGLMAREGERRRRRSATIMAVLGAAVVALGAFAYAGVAIEKLF
jgi:hypothetical protein